MTQWYKNDLAYIHDIGHSDYALKSAPGILDILTQNNLREGLIVDLGCGSGLSALEFTKAGYHVLGVDISESLIAIARNRVPDGEFRVESLFKTDIPPCNAVTSIGECLNYLFDADNNQALNSGGVFIFDIAEPGQILPGNTTKGFTEGQDWIVLVEKEENQENQTLTRRIITLRKVGETYRRDEEIHSLQLYKATDVAEALHNVGFQVQIIGSYGEYNLPKAHAGFIARKPILDGNSIA
jgi:SAM-dependent methyltransferase